MMMVMNSKPQQLSTWALTLFAHEAYIEGEDKPVPVGMLSPPSPSPFQCSGTQLDKNGLVTFTLRSIIMRTEL